MLPFADKPYTYQPPSYFAPTAWFLRAMNGRYRLPHLFRIKRYELQCADRMPSIADGKTRLIFIANHSTHLDAMLLIETCRRLKVRPRTMAAYDIYLRGSVDAWVFRRLGCFSVDRDGSDKQALDEAARTIEEGKFCLSLFPEGNVYLENDHVTPFQDGASLLAVRGAKALQEKGVRVVIVPLTMKLTHTTDCRPVLKEKIRALAKHVGVTLDENKSPADCLGDIARAALARELKGHGVEAAVELGNLEATTTAAAVKVLNALEKKLDLGPPRATDMPMDRVRRARRVIHEIRIDPARAADHRVAATWAEEAMLAFRIASYSPHYVTEKPSIDRLAEWIEKLHEDLFDQIPEAYADRAAILKLGEPVDVTALLASGVKQKQLVGQITETMEATIQQGLDEINSESKRPGGTRWDTPLNA